MSLPDYFLISNGLAITQCPEDSFITYCLVSCFLLLCALPLITYFKNSILQTFMCIGDSKKCTYFYIAYIFESLHGLYTIWKELKQLQPQDQRPQQTKTGNSLVQISPPPEELHRSKGTVNTTFIHRTDTIYSGPSSGFPGMLGRTLITYP